MEEHIFNKTIRKSLGLKYKKPKYKKISWEELENKLNQEIKEHNENNEYCKTITHYLEYLKGELEVELFIAKDTNKENK